MARADKLASEVPARVNRVMINDVSPTTPDLVSFAKGTAGHPLVLAASVFADGHDVIAARARWRARGKAWSVVPMVAQGNDRFEGIVLPRELGAHQFVVEGWIDHHATWRHRVELKLAAGQDIVQELEEGARLIEAELDRLPAQLAVEATDVVSALRDEQRSAAARLAPALEGELGPALSALPDREQTASSATGPVWIERYRAAIGAWYELFPRSYGGLQGAAKRLAAIADMGFDVVYLPPIHPIGTTARKGPGNSLDAGPDDVGSPWAIGSPAGGHTAIDPNLGTLDDFDDLVAEAERLGMEVALDYALQCSPDHPWVREHPEWFSHRPDGSIRFAENPPKQYQDIFPINFMPPDPGDRAALWEACLDILRFWIARGIRIFRVDNPHTKAFPFWEWLIGRLRQLDPDVVLLGEAFTRPSPMHRLAEIGFSQSYTYFTWRTTKEELAEYGEELARGPASSYFRPNLWPNTPDILSGVLRNGPPAAFKLRAVLAATMGPSWGIYSGYELCENQPASDANEEYAASEKFELKDRNWDHPGSLAGFITRLNDVRHRHPALADLRSLRFHHTSSDWLVAYSKQVEDDVVVSVVNLDPHAQRDGTLWLELEDLGLPVDEPLDAYDELTRQVFSWWGPEPYVRIDPETPAHVIHLRPASAVPFSSAVRP